MKDWISKNHIIVKALKTLIEGANRKRKLEPGLMGLDEGIKSQRALLIMIGLAGLAFAGMFTAWSLFKDPGQLPDTGAAGTEPAGLGNLSGNGSGPAQDIYLKALAGGTYDKREITVKKGVPVKLHFTADKDAGCGRQLVVYGLNVNAISKNGEENVVQFTPQKTGSFEYNCGMRMFRPGKLVVV